MTSIRNAAVSVSCAQLCLDTERPDSTSRAKALFLTATRDGLLKVLQWGEESGHELKKVLDQDTIADVALNGHLEVVQYMRTLGLSWNSEICANAAKKGHLKIMKWARANQCPWDKRTCHYAAKNGNIEMLKGARAHQECPWNERTCSSAATNGHIKILKWARAHQCPWDESTCSYATKKVTLKSSNGPGRINAHGMKGYDVHALPIVVTSKSSNGPGRINVHGMKGRVPMLP